MEWVFIKIDMKIVADRNIPFLEGVFEPYCEVAYVDAFGDWHYKPMLLASITPRYLTFREGSRTGSIGWVEVKVSRIGTGLGFAYVFWRDKRGVLKCRLQEVENSFD